MCGIAGKIHLNPGQAVDPDLLDEMTDIVAYRGPDGRGVYRKHGVGLGHRRLSIIDLAGGDQPMTNEDGSIWVVFNGEIYNYRELRAQLQARGHTLATSSDTEVLVHLYEDFGESLVDHLCGMFSFAIYDERKRKLVLARDRVGIKPVYYAVTPDAVLFASELKSILVDPTVPRELDPRVIDRFVSYLYLPGDRTPFSAVRKLLPGHMLTVEAGEIRIRRYWDLADVGEPSRLSYEAASDALAELLTSVTAGHLLSDVPVGCLLSGGVDSTSITQLAAMASSRPVSTFTIGFEGRGITDERPFARLAAERIGTQHHETTISAQAFHDFLPRYVWHMEEPVCEPPAIALYFIAELAASHVKVVLSGEGGDEAFAGYSNYPSVAAVERVKRRLGPFRGLLGPLAGLAQRLAPSRRTRRLAALAGRDLRDYYWSRTSCPADTLSADPAGLYTAEFAREVERDWSIEPTRALFERVEGRSPLQQMLYVDTCSWLPDDLLTKADKITMANSLELRVPLLDHRVLEFAARLPDSYKLDGRNGKRILRDTFAPHIPREVLERPKAGFPVPFANWFRNELRDEIHDVLLDGRTLGRGYFRPERIKSLLADDARTRAHGKEVFSLVALEYWHRAFVDRPT